MKKGIQFRSVGYGIMMMCLMAVFLGCTSNQRSQGNGVSQSSGADYLLSVTSIAPDRVFSTAVNWSSEFTYASGFRVQDHPVLSGDVDGDGRSDLVGIDSSGVWVLLSNSEGLFENKEKWLNDFGYAHGWRVQDHVRVLADVNNDGRDDIVGFASEGVFVALSTGGSFAPKTLAIPQFGYQQGWRVNEHVRTLGDVDGDGFVDVVGFGSEGVWVAYNDQNGGFDSVSVEHSDFGLNQGWSVQNHVRAVTDMNGDGLDDVVGIDSSGVFVSIAKPNRDGFSPRVMHIPDFAYAHGWRVQDHPRMIEDIDGDQKGDVVGVDSSAVHVYLGDGSEPKRTWISYFAYVHGWRVQDHYRMLGDVNGDGYKDFIGIDSNNVKVSLSVPSGY